MHKEQVSQLETIYKLAHSGFSPEDISSTLKINVETIQEIIPNDPMHRARMVDQREVSGVQVRAVQQTDDLSCYGS
jgi:hypothetical protein